MKSIIISGGDLDAEFVLDFLSKNKKAYVIAADRGLYFCHKYNVAVDEIVGDFDSLPEDILPYYADSEGKGLVKITRLLPEKDDSDTQAAASLLMKRGADTITILGGTGGRIDHLLANISLVLYLYKRGIRAELIDRQNRICFIPSGMRLLKEEQFGTYVSFLSLSDEVLGLTLTGFKYPLSDYTLLNTSAGLGISNEITKTEARVEYRSGDLLMIQSRD